ncbi:MAG: response regulator [Candidatus Aminicenantes bacterium]|nr:response regulator [Candidatus Aminicenantes bacterium]
METAEKAKVLVIDDEESMRDSCSLIILKEGLSADTAENGESGLKKVGEIGPDIVLIDLKMPGIGGLEVLERLREIDPTVIAVVITGYGTVESAVEAMKRGAYDFLQKPFTPEELRRVMRRGLERRKLIRETEKLRREKKLMEENFITMVSHQLRSPLVAIQQYFEVMLAGMAGKVEEKQKNMIQRGRDRLESLLNLINDWLDMARMNRGLIADKLKPISLEKMLQNLVDFMQPLAKESEVKLEIIPGEGSSVVQGDEETLEQVFSNLISNAIKYNRPQGTVVIGIREEGNKVVVDVADTGIGIDQKHLPFVFDQFYRVDRKEGQKIKGTGLGLCIAKKIVEAHEGSIQVTSVFGEGSTFSVFLPKTENNAPGP